jgi:hypothetical protein
MFMLGLAVGVASCVGVFAAYIFMFDGDTMDEEWCGCDGEGMAHTPGADGFDCATDPK